MTEDEQNALHDANEPRFHKCESCEQGLPEDLEGCHCDVDANWFCPECWKDLDEPEGLN